MVNTGFFLAACSTPFARFSVHQHQLSTWKISAGSGPTLELGLQFLVLCYANKLLPLGVLSPVGLRIESPRGQRERDEEIIQKLLLEDEGTDYVDRNSCEEVAAVVTTASARHYGQTRMTWGAADVLDLPSSRLSSLFEPDALYHDCLPICELQAGLVLGQLLQQLRGAENPSQRPQQARHSGGAAIAAKGRASRRPRSGEGMRGPRESKITLECELAGRIRRFRGWRLRGRKSK
jgi:hypothetical protein